MRLSLNASDDLRKQVLVFRLDDHFFIFASVQICNTSPSVSLITSNLQRFPMYRSSKLFFALTFLLAIEFSPSLCFSHDGPDPVAHWVFRSDAIDGTLLRSRLGPDARFSSSPRIVSEIVGESTLFRRGLQCTISEDAVELIDDLPSQDLTISAWVAIDQPEKWGGLIGVISDDGNAESGWLLGYRGNRFTFALASEGADDGDGRLTYLDSTTEWSPGKLYHVVAVYDGTEMNLYVNGKMESTSKEQSGRILYPQSKVPFTLGGYRDRDEDYRLQGRIKEIAVYDLAAKEAWVAEEFAHEARLAAQEARVFKSTGDFVVPPYLQFATQTGMTVCWETPHPMSTTLQWGETSECRQQIKVEGLRKFHEVRIEQLQPETQYFYAVESSGADERFLESPVLTFSTAVHETSPYAFVVIGDTQGNPTVSLKLAEMAWAQRPNFCIHAGDLVSTGPNDSHWTQHFFPGMKPLIERVPFYPVLGNHEQNADNYFRYVSLPAPEYYYSFRYGNSQFFMIDSNRNVDPGSEQFEWLNKGLAESTAKWKFVCHHHPPYSSDENDYGDLWKTNKSTRGDLRVRQLAALYDKYGVDIVWNGHIHSYERTWPIRDGQPGKQGTIYMITGGGGGGLETAGPYRPSFQNNVKHGHHYCLVAVNNETLEFKAFDLEGRLFDAVKIEKITPSSAE